jgi:acyl-CoA dehydrogenase
MTKDLPLERWYRELRIKRIGERASEIQRITIARGLLGRSMNIASHQQFSRTRSNL